MSTLNIKANNGNSRVCMGFPYTFWSERKSRQSEKGGMSVFLPRYLIFYSLSYYLHFALIIKVRQKK